MRLDVDPAAVVGVADAAREAAERARAIRLPRAPACEDVAASDAIGALLAVSGVQLHSCVAALRLVAALVETAAVDYARTEARATAAPVRP